MGALTVELNVTVHRSSKLGGIGANRTLKLDRIYRISQDLQDFIRGPVPYTKYAENTEFIKNLSILENPVNRVNKIRLKKPAPYPM